jgi:hypothetical protein
MYRRAFGDVVAHETIEEDTAVCSERHAMSAFGGKADIPDPGSNVCF